MHVLSRPKPDEWISRCASTIDGQTTAKERSSQLGINAQNLNATANTGLKVISMIK